MSAVQYVRWDHWRGWDPHQLPPTYLDPRDLLEGQVLDARGVRFSRGGSLVWERDQLRIHSPTGKTVYDLAEYRTDAANQLLAFCSDGTAHFLTTDWPNAVETPWTYGYRLFEGIAWTQVTGNGTSYLNTSGIADVVQAGDALVIAPGENQPILRWDGQTLTVMGLDAPPSAPTLDSVSATGSLASGTYSYYYTYYDPDTGYESMPSPILDVTVSTDGSKIALSDISDYGDGYWKRLYRGYTTDTSDNARAEDFYLVTTLPPGSADSSTEDLTTWTEVDVEGRLTVSSSQVTATGLERDDTCYLYSDETSISDFEYRFRFSISSIQYGHASVLMAVTDTVGLYSAWTNALYLWVGSRDNDDLIYLTLTEETPTSTTGKKLAGWLDVSTTYYVRFIRSGTAAQVMVYTTSDYSGEPVISGTITCSTTAYRYLYVATPRSYSSTETATYTVGDLNLAVTTSFTDNTPEYALGENIAFDHALPPRGSLLCWHKERLFIAGSTEGSRSYDGYDSGYWENCLFYSELDEPFYYPGTNLLVIGDDAPIVGLCSFGDYLVVLKTNSVWAVRGWSDDDMRVDLITAQVGCVGAYGSSPVGVLWQAADGYYYWDGAQMQKLLSVDNDSPWGLPDSSIKASRIAYHGGRFYILQDGGWLEYEPARGVWCFRTADYEERAGIRSYDHGSYQSHALVIMKWASGGDYEITVLDAGAVFQHGSDAGTNYSDYHAPIQVTLGPLEAPPGHKIIPVEVALDCTYTAHADEAKRPKLFINTDAAYSDTEGDNAWQTTPNAPVAGQVIGIPPSYEYGSSDRTNVASRWYVQIAGDFGQDFELHGITIGYILIRG